MNEKEPNGRHPHIWRGQDRKEDIAELTKTIAVAVPDLVNHDGQIAQLDGDGKLMPVNLATLRELIGKHVCGVRVVASNGMGRKEYFPYRFDAPPHPGPPRWETGLQREARSTGPDAKTLEEIYKHELVGRLPRVV
jgi:hypothetical protein